MPGKRQLVVGALTVAALAWAYWHPIAFYLLDQHYQEHFVYLWVLLGLALFQTVRPPFRSGFSFAEPRDRFALAGVLLAWLLYCGGIVAGASMPQRVSLAVMMTSLALIALPAWTWRRCVLHGLLLLMCFGVPYSIYQPITSRLQAGLAAILELPARSGLFDYEVVGTAILFPHYTLTITADCSGVGQLLTFGGIAALGILTSAANRWRSIGLLCLAPALAWLSNLTRVVVFTVLAGSGWTEAVDNDTWHALVGLLVFLPFVVTLVWIILRTHRPRMVQASLHMPPARWHVAWLAMPLVLFAWLAGGEPPVPDEPPWFRALLSPPGHVLEMRAPSEDSDRRAYSTPWLLNARFTDDQARWFDLLHYTTNSRSHLCVHKVANCLTTFGAQVTYVDAVRIAGADWWRLDIAAEDGWSFHAYFAFTVDGQRRDDSWATQWQVFENRLFGDRWDVQLWRVVFPGRLPEQPGAHETAVLTWLAQVARS